MANFEDMSRFGYISKRRTMVMILLSCAVTVLVFHSRTLGSSEHLGVFEARMSPESGKLIAFSYKAIGQTPQVDLKSRVAHLRKECSKQDVLPADPALDPPFELIVDEKYSLIYCNVPKVGCTNWKSVFLKISGIDDFDIQALKRLPTNTRGRIYLNYFHKYTNVSHRRFMLRNFTKFMFARHPFTRVLSAFRNKLAPYISVMYRNKRKEDVNWVEKYGLHIIEKYRGEDEAKRIRANWRSEYDLKFSEFVRYLIESEPTTYDKHWKPITTLCRPCDVRYDVIGKYETLNDDADYILRSANVDPRVKYPQAAAKSTTNSSSLEILKRYYSAIPRQQLHQLYAVYKNDFELFDYNFEAFLK